MRFFRFAKPCLLCHEVQADVLCAACRDDLRHVLRTGRYCACCTKSSLHTNGSAGYGELCLGCEAVPPPYQCFWASAHYISPLPELLHRWKHGRQAANARVFQWLMQENPPPWLAQCGADCILPMPVSPQRRLQRGFNQSDELAGWVARHYGLPMLPAAAVPREHRAAQSSLNREQRYDNIRQIFAPGEVVKNRKVLIIDDICTTKASISELAGSLHQSGAEAVFVWVVACSE